jgi:hypothetical protein
MMENSRAEISVLIWKLGNKFECLAEIRFQIIELASARLLSFTRVDADDSLKDDQQFFSM